MRSRFALQGCPQKHGAVLAGAANPVVAAVVVAREVDEFQASFSGYDEPLRRLEAVAAVERGQRRHALKKYITLAWENPFTLAGWILLLRFLLGHRTFRLARAVMGKMRKSELS